MAQVRAQRGIGASGTDDSGDSHADNAVLGQTEPSLAKRKCVEAAPKHSVERILVGDQPPSLQTEEGNRGAGRWPVEQECHNAVVAVLNAPAQQPRVQADMWAPQANFRHPGEEPLQEQHQQGECQQGERAQARECPQAMQQPPQVVPNHHTAGYANIRHEQVPANQFNANAGPAQPWEAP